MNHGISANREVSCLRLHVVGFALPRPSPVERCALTAPLHPYRALSNVAVYFLWHCPWPAAKGRWGLPTTIVLPCSDFPPADGSASGCLTPVAL